MLHVLARGNVVTAESVICAKVRVRSIEVPGPVIPDFTKSPEPRYSTFLSTVYCDRRYTDSVWLGQADHLQDSS